LKGQIRLTKKEGLPGLKLLIKIPITGESVSASDEKGGIKILEKKVFT